MADNVNAVLTDPTHVTTTAHRRLALAYEDTERVENNQLPLGIHVHVFVTRAENGEEYAYNLVVC